MLDYVLRVFYILTAKVKHVRLLLISVPSSPEASNTSQVNTIPTKGIYTLIIFLSKEIRVRIGQLGVKSFHKGYYTYTGSALGTGASSLKQRLSRHLRKARKKKRWHIDFLLAHRNAVVTAVVAAQTDRKMECELNCHIEKEGVARIPVPGFGSSDCKENCRSHLLFFPDITKEQDLVAKVIGCARLVSSQVFVWRPKENLTREISS